MSWGGRAHPEQLLPPLTARQELVLLARALWREGYDDHLAGHITVRQPDGTFLCTPWLLVWEELRPSDVIRIDLEGRVVEGRWPVPLGIPLHLELHRRRHHVGVALHHHPRFGTVWADAGRLPGCYDQSSALGGGEELPEPARSFFRGTDGEGFIGFWEAMARRELRLDPTLLDDDA